MDNKFYVVRVKYLPNGEEKKSELMDYPTQLEAESKFYKNIGTDMEDTTLLGSMCMVVDKFGNEIQSRYWSREIVPTTAE